MVGFKFSKFVFVLGLSTVSYAFANPEIDNFATVDEQAIYRGARPTMENMEQLKEFGIKAIVTLDDNDEVVAAERKKANELGIKHYSIPIDSLKYPRDHQINTVLQLLMESKNQPVFLHCKHGRDRTGLVIGLYRYYFQNWTRKMAYDEMISLGFRPFMVPLKRYFLDKTKE